MPAMTTVLAETQSALRTAKKKRAEILIDEARKRVERNPTDLQLRFELGEHLMNAGQFREALPELQRARQNPNARLKAMNLLGRCYRELGMLDLAAKQLEEAAREIADDGRDEEGNRLQSRAGLRADGRPREIDRLHEANLRSGLRLQRRGNASGKFLRGPGAD